MLKSESREPNEDLAQQLEIAADKLPTEGDGLYHVGLMLAAARRIRKLQIAVEELDATLARQVREGTPDLESEVEAPMAARRCRHTWADPNPATGEIRCNKCSALKGKQGRPSNASRGLATVDGVTKADPPTAPLPLPPPAAPPRLVGSVAADRFTGGTVK
jgi:hypothetical protein